MPKQEYDKQGKYFWSLVKQAGWTEERVNMLLLKRWKATHWNALATDQKRAAINMMRGYAEKANKDRAKHVRQATMAYVAKQGYTLEWLHERMQEWGYGDSMRKLSLGQVTSLRMDVLKACGGENAR